MSVRQAFLWCLALTGVAIVASAILAPALPDTVPTHWDVSGRADAFGPKWMNLLIMPAVMLVFTALIFILPTISPKHFHPARFAPTWNYVMVAVEGLFLAMHLIILDATRSGTFEISRLMPAALFAFFILMGNVLGRVKRNFWMGVRTPWTLADERVWDATHRAAGRLWFVMGWIGLALGLLGVPFWILFALIMLMAFLPVVQSYLIWKRIGNGPTAA